MDKFEKILREKLQNHDAGMANGAWEQFAQNNITQFDSFENAVRNKVENHDAGITNGAWEQFAQRMNPAASSWKYYLTGGIAAALIGVGAYYFSGDDATTDKNKVQVIENTNPIAKNNNVTNNSTLNTNTNDNNTIPNVNNNGTDPVVINSNGNVESNNDTKVDNHVVVNEVKKDKDKVVSNDVVKVDKKDDVKVNNTIETNVASLIKPEFSIEASEVCQNSELTFKALNNKNDFESIWLVNGEEVATGTTTKITFHKIGAQQIQLMYASTVNGKRIVSESDKASINVMALPINSFEINKTNIESIPEYTLTPEKVNGATFLWNFGDGKFSTEEVVAHVFKKKGQYPVSLTVTGANGCQLKAINKLDIQTDYNLLAPNAFSPNGDGINETFIPAALTIMSDVRFKMTIMDRAGKKLFETSRIDAAWDGVNATTGAKCAPNNAYIWRVVINNPNGGVDEYSGTVTMTE